MPARGCLDVIIVGGGLAGLSAAVYLARAKRKPLVIDSGKSMARWEPEVQNYLGFPEGIPGDELLRRSRKQAKQYGAKIATDEIVSASVRKGMFVLRGNQKSYRARRVLLATGSFHIPPDIPGVRPCLGRSMFFCKDCDGYRMQGKSIAIYGWSRETAEYAIAMRTYSPRIMIATDGRRPCWSGRYERLLRNFAIPVRRDVIKQVRHAHGRLQALVFAEKAEIGVEGLFTARGDVYLSKLAQMLGARVNRDGEISVRQDMRTNISGLYAAGCVTPANCQMIIAAGQGATAAQAINRDLFEESLKEYFPSSKS